MKFNDAQAALGFVIAQTTHVETAVNNVIYPDIQYPSIVPVDTSAPEWVKSVTYFSGDKFGQADWINGNADDVPRAGTTHSKFETPVHTAGIGYGYGLEEINQAAMLGINLANDDAMAARRAYEEMVDRVAISGDVRKGFEGLINSTAVTAGSAITGNWGTATNDQIIADFNGAIIGQFTGTLFTSMADTVLLPYTRFLKLSSTKAGTDGSSVTLLQWLQANNVYTATTGRPLTIKAIRGLETAGAGGTMRMVSYRRDPAVVKLHIPMPHRFLPAYQSGPLRVDIPGIFRLGGVDWRRPKEAAYTDGI